MKFLKVIIASIFFLLSLAIPTSWIILFLGLVNLNGEKIILAILFVIILQIIAIIIEVNDGNLFMTIVGAISGILLLNSLFHFVNFPLRISIPINVVRNVSTVIFILLFIATRVDKLIELLKGRRIVNKY